jgi:PAS domain S-box-containing protein
MNTTPFDSIFAHFPCGLCVVDGEGKILNINSALEQLLGWRATERLGQRLAVCLEQTIPDPGQVLGWTVALNQALSLGQTTHLSLPTEFRSEGKDASPVSITGIVAPWQGSNGEDTGAVAIFHDISLQKDLYGARARLLAVLSHELGTPVANLTAAADLLAKRLEAGDKPLGRLLHVIQSEANHLRRLLAQFPLAPSARMKSPQPRKSLVTLRPILRQVAQAFGVRDLDCEIVVRVPPGLPFVWSDAEQIRQVLSKLVDNAIRYAPPGSQIDLAAEEEGEEIVVSVRDRGPGVAEGDEELIFEAWRCGSREEPDGEHQGLGLSIARRLVRSLGGKLWYESRPGGGASLCFSLPRAQEVLVEEGDATTSLSGEADSLS